MRGGVRGAGADADSACGKALDQERGSADLLIQRWSPEGSQVQLCQWQGMPRMVVLSSGARGACQSVSRPLDCLPNVRFGLICPRYISDIQLVQYSTRL
jgi:hypothetical protein